MWTKTIKYKEQNLEFVTTTEEYIDITKDSLHLFEKYKLFQMI